MAANDRPSILLFFMDQLSARWVEAALRGVAHLPNLQRLQRCGVTFRNAVTSNPVCCPARATVATGLTTRQHGVLENGYRLDPALPTFMRVLRDAGWRTGAFGKVHFHPHYAGLYPDYTPYGFETAHITEDPRGGAWLDWVRQTHPEHFEAALATVLAPEIPDFAAYGPDKENLRPRILRARESFSWATPEFPESTANAYALPFPREVSQTAWITERALAFMDALPAETPFLAQVSYVQPHGPYCAPAEHIRLIDPAALPAPAPAEWMSDPHAPGYFRGRSPEQGNRRHARRCYFASLTFLDEQLGRVLDRLDALGRAESTCILLLSDHGDLLYDHGFVNKEERHYDACIRVPLVVAGPGLDRGRRRDEFAQLEDICPTVLELTGLSLPVMPKTGANLRAEVSAIPQLPGRSLVPLCRGAAPPDWRRSAYSESYNAIWSIDPGDWARTIRTHRYRYTLYPRGNGEQLFDLVDDPDEQSNLAGRAEHADTRRRLRDELLERIILQDYPKTRRDLFALGVH